MVNNLGDILKKKTNHFRVSGNPTYSLKSSKYNFRIISKLFLCNKEHVEIIKKLSNNQHIKKNNTKNIVLQIIFGEHLRQH